MSIPKHQHVLWTLAERMSQKIGDLSVEGMMSVCFRTLRVFSGGGHFFVWVGFCVCPLAGIKNCARGSNVLCVILPCAGL